MQVALSINAHDMATARDLALRAPGITGPDGIAHIDVYPGSFQGILMPRGMRVEVHLMVPDWEARLTPWLEAGAFRAVIPADYIDTALLGRAVESAARYGASIMPSFRGADALPNLRPYAGITAFQILAVPEGSTGHSFDSRTIATLRALRAAFPDAILEIDGGITPITAARAKEAGADVAVSASCIWNAASPQAAYDQLSRI
jgi:ribulose-phosphate 3-epimerase